MEEKNERPRQPEQIGKSDETAQLLEEYVSQFNDIEQIAYTIAVESLKTSFDLEKSIGFITWKKEKIISS
jgi:CRISPR/Cas system-associated protein Cas7 (RAMP superfamily)